MQDQRLHHDGRNYILRYIAPTETRKEAFTAVLDAHERPLFTIPLNRSKDTECLRALISVYRAGYQDGTEHGRTTTLAHIHAVLGIEPAPKKKKR